MKIQDVVSALERFAPLPLQDDFDNAGLQIGLTTADVSGVLLCLDVTEAVVEEAVARGAQLIVAHHPLLFRPLRHVTAATEVERCVRLAIKHDVAIYAAHTNLDNARGGVNFEIASRLGLHSVEFLRARADGQGGSGVIGRLPEPMETASFLRLVKETFGADCLMHNAAALPCVSTVALCGGAGDFLLDDALRRGADCFLTGEMHYHHYFGHEKDIVIGVLGHYETEQFTVNLLSRILREALPSLRTFITQQKTNPIHYLYAETTEKP